MYARAFSPVPVIANSDTVSHVNAERHLVDGRPYVQTGITTMFSIDLNQPGHYVDWGVVHISVANLVVIVTMIVVFVAALLLPFPGTRRDRNETR